MKNHLRLNVKTNSGVHMYIVSPDDKKMKGCIVFSHGFLVPGFESHRMFIELANDLKDLDYMSILFDYRGSGYSDLEFSEMTIDTEIDDLDTVLNYVKDNFIDGNKIIVWGQSLGSAVASLVVSKRHDISGIILWCLSANLYERYKKNFGEKIIEEGSIYLPAGFNVSLDFLDSLEDKDVYNAIAHMNIPKLLVHGDRDDKAPVELSKKAFEVARPPKELLIIPGGNHAFKAQPDLFMKAKNKSFEWIEKTL